MRLGSGVAMAVPIQPLAWKLLYAAGTALKKKKKKLGMSIRKNLNRLRKGKGKL